MSGLLGAAFDRWARMARMTEQEFAQKCEQEKLAEEYAREQIASAQSEAAQEANRQEYSHE